MCMSTKARLGPFYRLLITFALSALPLLAAAQPWESLTAQQQEVLAPFSGSWNTLPEKERHNLLGIAKRYPKLPPQKQQRLHQQIEKWSKLTPEQRKRAREKYNAFSKVPADKREAVKKMVRDQQAGQAASSAEPASPSP